MKNILSGKITILNTELKLLNEQLLDYELITSKQTEEIKKLKFD